VIYLDTHVVVWLYAAPEKLTDRACNLIEQNETVISPIVLLELEYLKEIKRLKVSSGKIFENLANSIGLTTCDIQFGTIISESLSQTWTRDSFDRIIVANAIVRGAQLITKDGTILQNYEKAVWG
jgi:PIN domain nuclease of toxin-antitoxin system